jgi:hypothetical protein
MALPTALAIALICSPLSGFAQDATRDSVQEQLALFSEQQTAPNTVVKQQTIATTTPDNLVYAVYDAVLALGPNATQNAITTVVTEALAPRKDKDKLAGRVVAAAIAASGRADDPAYLTSIVTGATSVTGLTPSGKALAVSAALRFSTPTDQDGADNANSSTDTGAAIGAAARSAAGAGNEQAFALAVLKLLGNNANNVPEFVDTLIGGDLSSTTAITLARGLTTQPAVAGAVIAAAAAEATDYTPGSNNTAVTALLNSVVTDAKLAKAVTEAIAQSDAFTTEDSATLAGTLASANKKVAGAITAGFLRAPDADVEAIVEKTVASGGVLAPQFALFASQAAVGIGENADELTTALLNRRSNQSASPTADRANIVKIAAAVANTVGLTDPMAAQDVGAAVANATVDPDGTGPTQPTDVYAQGDLAGLATNLARAVNKNYVASGAVVAGVATAATDQSLANRVAIANAGTIGNAKAAAGITLQVARLFTGTTEIRNFAVQLATASKATNGAQIALGAAIASPTEPGEVVREIANLSAQRKSALKIATTVAGGVDIEAISDVTEKVSTLFGSAPEFPKIASLSALATSMVKAINAKPVAPKANQVMDRGMGATLYGNFTQFNRVDEIGEVAASLVNAALDAGSTDAKLIGAIGTSIFKAVSQKLLADTGLNLADIKDVAQDVAGAIFQTISVSDQLNDAQKAALLNSSTTDKTTLLALLSKGAGVKYTELVRTALNEVTSVGIGNFVPGGENQDTTKYEVGAVIESETPVVNL